MTISTWTCGGHRSSRPEDEWAEGWEVVVPRRGAFEWTIGGERALADPGTATLLTPLVPYRVRHPVSGGDAGTVFALAAAGARALRFPRATYPLDGPTYLLHRLALRAAQDENSTPLEVEERAAAFLRALMAQACRVDGVVRRAPEASPRRAVELVHRVREVVAARYREPLTLAEIAAAVGASPWHLSRLVTAAGGVPIYRLVVRRRLRDALELLLESEDTIARIAVTVGFASHSHLTEAFRREFGTLPGALRARRRRMGARRAPP